MRERGLEQHIGADDIGVDEIGRTVDRSVDVAFRRQMHDRVGIEARKNVGDGRTIADIGAAEAIARMSLDAKRARRDCRRRSTCRRQAPRDRCDR